MDAAAFKKIQFIGAVPTDKLDFLSVLHITARFERCYTLAVAGSA